MKIRFKRSFESYKDGQVYDLPPETAQVYINAGVVEVIGYGDVASPPSKAKSESSETVSSDDSHRQPPGDEFAKDEEPDLEQKDKSKVHSHKSRRSQEHKK